MNSCRNSWINKLELLIQKKHMLSHPMYQAWTMGKLSKETLQNYAKEYYHHVKAFPTYLSALHSRCDDADIRKSLLGNLIDEEAGSPNHPDLWRSFALSLDIDEEDLNTHVPSQETKNLINHFRSTCNNEPLAVGIAALYAYESQIPAICETKIDGLKKWYGFQDEEDYRYFSVHETADIEHSQDEMKMLEALVTSDNEGAVLSGVEKTVDALWDFLSLFSDDYEKASAL